MARALGGSQGSCSLILLSDANILIDLGYVDGLSLLPKIAPVEVLDVVLSECDHPSQPSLVEDIRACGIREVATEVRWMSEAKRVKGLSSQDALNLYYAARYGRVLLTGDNRLRKQSDMSGVEVHGSIWLAEQAYRRELVATQRLCYWLHEWSKRRRLPDEGLGRLREILGCR